MARQIIGARGKTVRAFDAYLDLIDAADWIRDEMSRQLNSWDLTFMQFRVLESIYRHGPQYQQAISHRFRCSRQSVQCVIQALERSGCIRRAPSYLPAVPSGEASHRRAQGLLKRDELDAPVRKTVRVARGGERRGRKIVLLRLTPEGKDLIAHVFPKHAKVVKSHMRVLDGREQVTLSRLCRKLWKGDIIKFVREITMPRDE
jgi:DNA-binding MarR family transcriptional regulator